jgi:transcriptional regulator with GAF, ATPase, and Fis domain
MIRLLKKPFSIAISNAIRHQELIALKDTLKEGNQFLQEELKMVRNNEIIGTNMGLKYVMTMVRKIATLSSPILLLGETGTGKEMIANAIHYSSNRKEEPFIKINCGAIPENLVDSELFGHEKGAFTGAISMKKGRFELADKGTLFLDEIGELTPAVQIRLLRAIQEKEIERVGGSGPVKVDIRIIAATHRNLSKLVKENKFREDLFFRLNVFPIAIPPLRERKSDILSLAQHFIQKKGMEMGLDHVPLLSSKAHEQLLAYPWPGNVRELENVVERAIILGQNRSIEFDELSSQIFEKPNKSMDKIQIQSLSEKTIPHESLSLEEQISNHIQAVLKITNGKLNGPNGAARLLKINPSTLRNKMKKLGIYKCKKQNFSPQII